MKVCFTGDVFLGGDLLDKSCLNLVNVRVFSDADKRIINLEQPISDSKFIENKSTLYTGSNALKQLNDLKIDAVNLANNHIQDKGLVAIDETVRHLDSAAIGSFGAGENIGAAGKPYWLTDDIAILGYCDFDKPYLRQVAVANENRPGTNPLRFETIKYDLDKIPPKKKVILYFHWGMEHVWLPTVNDIRLAKRLLEDHRVITIIGMHPHRIQGVVRHAGKEAFMSLGNFIFPNFYLKPPVQIFNPSEEEKKSVSFTTRQYLTVFKFTYKKWRVINRVSLVLDLCTDSKKIDPVYVFQSDDFPCIRELSGPVLLFFTAFIRFLSMLYKLPAPCYGLLWKLHAFQAKLMWRMQINLFYLKQIGIKIFLKKLMENVARKF